MLALQAMPPTLQPPVPTNTPLLSQNASLPPAPQPPATLPPKLHIGRAQMTQSSFPLTAKVGCGLHRLLHLSAQARLTPRKVNLLCNRFAAFLDWCKGLALPQDTERFVTISCPKFFWVDSLVPNKMITPTEGLSTLLTLMGFIPLWVLWRTLSLLLWKKGFSPGCLLWRLNLPSFSNLVPNQSCWNKGKNAVRNQRSRLNEAWSVLPNLYSPFGLKPSSQSVVQKTLKSGLWGHRSQWVFLRSHPKQQLAFDHFQYLAKQAVSHRPPKRVQPKSLVSCDWFILCPLW